MEKSRAHGHAGFTLVELLVVMAIITALAAMSLSGYFYMERAGRHRKAMAEAEIVFSAAANTAKWLSAPAWVIVEPADGTVVAYGLETVASWHFEAKEAGQGAPLQFKGNVEISAGYAGAGILVGMDPEYPEGGAVASVPAGLFPNGGYFECYIRPMQYGRNQVIFKWGQQVALTITEAGRLEGRVCGERLFNPDVRVNLFRWARFALLFGRHSAQIMMDDAILDTRAPKNFAALEGDVELPAVETPVHGCVDEARLLRVREVGRWEKRSGIAPVADKTVQVWFRADGTLDPERSPGPVVVAFSAEGSEERSFKVTVTAEGGISAAAGGRQ